MKNVKDQVYMALQDKFIKNMAEKLEKDPDTDLEFLKKMINVTDSYPTDWAKFPAVQYTEEENRVHERTRSGETKAYIRYKIDIWHNYSTSEAAMLVDDALSEIGLVRTGCSDQNEPTYKHKVMRYEGIIDMENDFVYWPE